MRDHELQYFEEILLTRKAQIIKNITGVESEMKQLRELELTVLLILDFEQCHFKRLKRHCSKSRISSTVFVKCARMKSGFNV